MRQVEKIINAQASQDGDGVSIFRSIGNHELTDVDPFLLLDEIKSDDATDYIGGFPSHPHRGFETVTYMLEGQMRHKDSVGNEGVIGPGDIQWMTAGSGIIHSEMPEQKAGRLWGFQLWVNLPASDKMRPPRYQEISSQAIPELSVGRLGVSTIRVLAGDYIHDGSKDNDENSEPQFLKENSAIDVTKGAVNNIVTKPLMLDIHVAQGDTLRLNIPREQAVVAYVYEGRVDMNGITIKTQQLARLSASSEIAASDGFDSLLIKNKGSCDDTPLESNVAGVLLIGAVPLGEPIARAGPFVMNSRQELEQAFDDYRNGRLTQ